MRKIGIALLNIAFIFLTFSTLVAQNVTLEGYVFEENNRGFLNEVQVKITDEDGSQNFCEVYSNLEGFFTCELPVGQKFVVSANKDVFESYIGTVSTEGKKEGDKVYTKLKMLRKPGYLLDATLAESIQPGSDVEEVDAVQGALVEIYNNTTKKEELVIDGLDFPNFQHTLEKGNHYTLMIRKEGFFTKRIEAYVDVDGCILCMDGVSEMTPGVSDNLTAGHQMGTLLANIQLDRAELNKSIEIKNIYYDFNSARIKTKAEKELDKLVFLLKNNPAVIVELGSHTDARGKALYNQNLSQERAQSAVDYIVNIGEINVDRIKAKGYGETILVNKCKDGVNCSEEEHQENRRTELKIIGFDDSKNEQKSLASIIEEEQFEVMLQEVLNQEVVEIKAGEKTPAELEREMQAEQEIRKAADAQAELERVAREKAALEQQRIKEEADKIKSNKPTASKTETRTSTQSTTVNDPFSLEANSGAIIGETRVTSTFENNAVAIAGDYTGFKIEIWKSEAPLDADHKIFLQHGNIALDVVKTTKFSYMIANFEKYEDADDYMRKNLLLLYPNAKVIQYKEGKRLDY